MVRSASRRLVVLALALALAAVLSHSSGVYTHRAARAQPVNTTSYLQELRSLRNFQEFLEFEEFEGIPDRVAPTAPPPTSDQPPRRTAFSWPATSTITQYFSSSHPAIDMADPMNTPIVSAKGGKVISAGWNTYGLGYAVTIDHGDGLVTGYAHLAAQSAVSVGQQVAQEEYLGPMGSTGDSTGPHLHFSIQQDGVAVDPLHYLPPR